jgi:hypothetical protein
VLLGKGVEADRFQLVEAGQAQHPGLIVAGVGDGRKSVGVLLAG